MPHHSNGEDSSFASMIDAFLHFRCISAQVEDHMKGKAYCKTKIEKRSILEIMKNLRTFAKSWSQWYVCQTGLVVVTHLMKSPTLAEWPMSTLAQPFHTLCPAITHYSTLVHTSMPHQPMSPPSARSVHTIHTALCPLHYSDGGYGGADLDHHTYPFCKIISKVYDHALKSQGVDALVQKIHIPFTLTTYSALPGGTRAGTVVSELVTLTKRLSKLAFAIQVNSSSHSISEFKAVTRAKLMIMVFEYTWREHLFWSITSTDSQI